MKLSTRSRYGLRMMFELALSSDEDKPLQLGEISKNQEISEKYLSKLVIPLKSMNLINSIRGSHGGYFLARAPEEIDLYEIISVLEGDISPVSCTLNDSECGKKRMCPTRDVWLKLESVIRETLEGVTLRDLVNNYREKMKKSVIDYSI
jgi:Rrf2 family protein